MLALIGAPTPVLSVAHAAVLSVAHAAVPDPFHTIAAGHEASDGFHLGALGAESVRAGGGCAPGAPVRAYRIVAIDVDITLNRFGDHDPLGRMYVLESELARVRAEEKQNAAARAGNGDYAVSLGLQTDAIQPLTLRVRRGECLRVTLRDALRGETASFHVHGSALVVSGTHLPAVASQLRALARPGKTVSTTWMVAPDEPEGTHYFHSHGDDRAQTSHGLFGAVIIEPRDAEWLDPLTGRDAGTSWAAVIHTKGAIDFREFVLYYHEIGDENYQLLDHAGKQVPLVDPLLSDYRPDGRALNYRSEPFMNRMRLQLEKTGRFDESLSYSSYSFGDPATPLMRSYVGDPVKERVVHAGSEVFHVHHVHGGSIRWRRQPGVEPSGFAAGLQKKPALVPSASERTDAQSIGPSETFDIENECGSGGCQQSVGDFLYHCHVAHHYFAGMWGIWRVYNTLQDGAASTDALPPLRELPERNVGVRAGVSSAAPAAAAQLPPPGAPRGYDASVWNWARGASGTIVGEPNESRTWPGYAAHDANARPAILFDPATGKPAYPFMRPHFGARPPFAPNHGPAPYLDPVASGAPLPAPGAHGASSLCPAGTRTVNFNIRAINVPIVINRKQDLVDSNGEIYALAGDVARIRKDPARRVPLAIRANAQQDCIDVLLTNDIPDSLQNRNFSKVNLHIHFVQFDVQASDGVITGFNYEQSVRPYRSSGAQLAQSAVAGARTIALARAPNFPVGAVVGIGMDEDATLETRRVVSIDATRIVLDRPLDHPHPVHGIVSTEFVRYRWYPDAQTGSAYFHDHVDALFSWQHGLFGALIVEPPGSSYRDPSTGAPVRSGEIADVVTGGTVGVDVKGSFRELAMFIQDQQPITHTGRSSGSAIGLRAEPLDARARDPATMFSSANGDPETPLLRAYLGDPIVVRALVGGTNDVHTWHIDGHAFRIEPWSASSPRVGTVHLGISERYDLVIPAAGGTRKMPGDYLWYDARSYKLHEGSWGLLRVLGARTPALRPLDGRARMPEANRSTCPSDAPARTFDVTARNATLPMLDGHGVQGEVFASTGAPASPVAPLVLHANAGDCIRLTVRNELCAPVSVHADMLAFDPAASYGIAAGRDPVQSIAPGGRKTVDLYADPEIGPTVAMLRDFADPLQSAALGLYGAIVVGTRGTTYSADRGWNVIARPVNEAPYRDVSVFMQDDDASIGTHRMPYTQHVEGIVGLNYRNAPRTGRAWNGRAPATPRVDAYAGDAIRFHVLVPWSEQNQVFSIEGHRWEQEPGRAGTTLLSSQQIGAAEAVTMNLTAGGDARLAGSYLYGDHREPYREAGLWGVFRVLDPCRRDPATPAMTPPICGRGHVLPFTIAIGLFALAVGAFVRRRYGARRARASGTRYDANLPA